MALSAASIKNAKPTTKALKLFDGNGLFLLLNPNGSRWWRFKYRYAGKEKLLSLGVYPDVSLKDARDRRDEGRKQVANGIDPGEHRKAQKSAVTERAENSFEVIAREWFARFSPNWAAGHSDKIIRRLERDSFPGSAAARLQKSSRPKSSRPCGGSRAAARSKPLTAHNRTAARYFATPWRPDARSVIQPEASAER